MPDIHEASPQRPLLIRSEFAAAHIWIDDRANGQRLVIRDLDTGNDIVLDPLEVASLTLLTVADLNKLATPR